MVCMLVHRLCSQAACVAVDLLFSRCHSSRKKTHRFVHSSHLAYIHDLSERIEVCVSSYLKYLPSLYSLFFVKNCELTFSFPILNRPT